MTNITANINSLRKELPSSVSLVAVSKTVPVNDIITAYECGQRIFGENRVQELVRKRDLLPHDIDWHFIGHLQSNKVKLIVPIVSMIQSVDSYKLLVAINTEASKIDKLTNCLLQIHIATEETKFGFSLNELIEVVESQEYTNLKNIRICGVMGMATYTSDTSQVSKEFAYLYNCFKILKKRYFSNDLNFKEISMGMSGDYKIAVGEGSTIVRIGSLIFGARK